MKRLILLMILPFFLIAKDVVVDEKMDEVNMYNSIYISIDSNLKMRTRDIHFSKKYKEIKIRAVNSEGSLDAINNLRKSKANIAIARGDVLGIKKNGILGLESYEDYGIICSPNRSVLYLVSKDDIMTINDLRDKRVSTGLTSNMAQVYLSDVAKNSSIALDISFVSLNLSDSIEALKRDEIDVIFMFAPQNYASKFRKNGLNIQSLPNDFFSNLTFKKGLNTHSYTIKGKKIRTYEVPNFIIAPTKTLDENINLKVESMVSAFKCYKTIQNIDSFYGEIHPDVKSAVSKIHKRVDKEGAIRFTFKRKVKSKENTKYFYSIDNRSKSDMNITFSQFKTKKFDAVPIKPRHLITTIPTGVIEIKGKSKKMITFTYENPFLYDVKKTKVETLYENLTVKSSPIKLFLTIGDEL